MYPIDTRQLLRRSTLGLNGTDPTVPHRPSRRLRARTRLAAMLRDTSGDRPSAGVAPETASAGCP